MSKRVRIGFRKARPAKVTAVVGVDVGSRLIKLIQAAPRGDHAEVFCWGMIPTPEGAVENGFVRNVDETAHALKRLVLQNGLEGQPACAAVPNCGVRIECDQVSVRPPQTPDVAAAASLAERFQDCPQADVREHAVLEHDRTANTALTAFVAGPSALIHPRAQVLAKALLQPVAIEVEPFAFMCGLLEVSGGPRLTEPAVLVDLGGSTFDLVMVEGGRFLGSRTLPASAEPGAAAAAIKQTVDAFALDNASEGVPWRPARLVVCGGGIDLSLAVAALEAELALPVDPGQAFLGDRLRCTRIGSLGASDHGPLLTLAAGLALRNACLAGTLSAPAETTPIEPSDTSPLPQPEAAVEPGDAEDPV